MSDPEFLKTGAALAAPAYLSHETDVAAGEALYCLFVAGQEDEAQALLDEMLTAAENSYEVRKAAAHIHNALGQIEWKRGRLSQAIGHFDQSLA